MNTRKAPGFQASAAASFFLMFAGLGCTAETDQFFGREQQIADSTAALNDKVNRKIAKIVARNRNEARGRAIAYEVYRELGGLRLTDRFESWLLDSAAVEKRRVARSESIYRDLPVWSIRAVYFSELGQTINIDGNLLGSDKISHFFSQGWKFYKRFNIYGSETRAARRGVLTEKAIFGAGMTGSFSNADLVANYEGHRFYRSLFEDDVVPGKPSILRWQQGQWVVQRKFDWADHVNPYWDEALNMNSYDVLLREHMNERLVGLCPRYWQNPSLYEIENETDLIERYAHLGMRDTRATRLDRLCLEHRPERRVLLAANSLEQAGRNQFGL